MNAAIDLLVGKLGGLVPRHGIILGSGLGSLVGELKNPVRVAYKDLPGFPVSAVSGHAGEVVAGRLGGVPVIMLSGRVHFYEKGDANAMRLPIEVLKGLGVQSLFLTNSAGSLREEMPPGSVMQMHGTMSPFAICGSQFACWAAVALRTMMSLISAVLMIR